MADTNSSAFLQRARYEAGRYGKDPWVFVRELVQNARDAGAHHVRFDLSSDDGRERIVCRDDGAGMSFEHARRYLFSLYASSKGGRSRTAGRFGIGFWSVLRFDPTEIVVRSRARDGEAWQVRLDGRLELARREPASIGRGTEIILERPASSEDLEAAVTEAVLRDAPFVRCRHRAAHALEIRVNGRLARREPALPAPSLSFRRRGLRGVVGLGPEPRAEVFAFGLRVRDASTLDELLVESRRDRAAIGATVEGLAPRAILDSTGLEVLLARGDAREDRSLTRLVAVGHRELRRLVRAELDRHAGLSWWTRSTELIREAWSSSKRARGATAVLLAGLLLAILWRMTAHRLPRNEPLPPPRAAAAPPLTVPFRDLHGRYLGPDLEGLGGVLPTVDLQYWPPDRSLHLAALWVTGITSDGRPVAGSGLVTGPYAGARCGESCLEVELRIESAAGVMRLPVATGHLVDPASVRLDGVPLAVVAVDNGQPAVRLGRVSSGSLRYRSVPAAEVPPDGAMGRGSWPVLPAQVAAAAREIADLPSAARAASAVAFVSARVRYDTSSETVEKHRLARRHTPAVFERALDVGAGDCDVQNALVAAVLAASGVPSRLAVGWIGVGGRARSALHAWAEYRGPDGRWRAVDASASGGVPQMVNADASAAGGGTGAPGRRWKVMVAMAAAAAGAVMLAVLVVGGRWRRSLRPGDSDDILGLLRGAAARPRAFSGVHSILSRRLLRRVGGRSISLAKARRLASEGRLACGSHRAELSRLGARGGGVVLDLDQPEARTVADALAAVDLDRWHDLLDRATGHELARRVEERLTASGEHCRIAVADLDEGGIAILDGSGFGFGRGTCWVVIDPASRLWRTLCLIGESHPARAALALADIVLSRIGPPPTARRHCLSTLARHAMYEAGGVGG